MSVASFSLSSPNPWNYFLFLCFFFFFPHVISSSWGNSVGSIVIKICPAHEPTSPSLLTALTLVQAAILSPGWLVSSYQASLSLPFPPTPYLVPVHQPELSFYNVRQTVPLLCSKPSHFIQRKRHVPTMLQNCPRSAPLHQPLELAHCTQAALTSLLFPECMLLLQDLCMHCSVCFKFFSSRYPLG